MSEFQSLALGTAQFGLDYGVTNTRGQLSDGEIATVLADAWQAGAHALDTAPAYGDSEARIGLALNGQPAAWRIITKTIPLRKATISRQDVVDVQRAFEKSAAQLSRPIDTLLLHHADDMLVPGGERLFEWMESLKATGQVRLIGASVYDGAQVERLLNRFHLDAIQLPASVADQRLLLDGTVGSLRAAGIEIHVRSLYLQGLLLARPDWVAKRMPALAPWSCKFNTACSTKGALPIDACIAFFRAHPAFSVAVVGALDSTQISHLRTAWDRSPPAFDWPSLAISDPALVDPRQWVSQ